MHEHLSLALLGASPAILASSILGLTALSLLSLSFPSALLPQETLGSICGRITSVVSDPSLASDSTVFSRCVDSLVSLARASPDLILEHSLPVLLQRIRLSAATSLSSHHAPSHDHTAAQEHSHSHSHSSHGDCGHDHSHSHSHSHPHPHSQSQVPPPDAESQLYTTVASLCVSPVIYDKVSTELLVMIQQLLKEDVKLPPSDLPINIGTAQHQAHQHDQAHTHARSHQIQAERAFACLADALSKNAPQPETVAHLCLTLIPGIIITLVELVTSPSPSSTPSSTGYHRSVELYLPHCLRIARTVLQKAEDGVQLELFNNVTRIFILFHFIFINWWYFID